MKLSYLILGVFLLASCTRAKLTDPALAYRVASAPPALRDSLDIGSLRMALERNIRTIESNAPNLPGEYRFGERVIPREDYRRALAALRPELESWERFTAFVDKNFEFYEVYGDKDFGQVLSTGYYDPVMKGSTHRTDRFTRPLYRPPGDLVSVDLAAFAERNPGLAPLQSLVSEQKSKNPVWRGRYIPETKRVVPYYERAEIDGPAAPLKAKGLEIAWLEPVDAFFLEIQGSGVVEMPAKSLRVGYAAQNGSAYVPIGKYLTHVIPLAEMSMQRIRAHLATLDPAARDAVLFKNPSYVFFQPLETQSLTYSGAEVTAGRTVATDKFLFPKGVLGYFSIEEPTFANETDLNASGWEVRPRFVFDQDTGGAIRGGGRVDLYVGQGPAAARVAGVMKREGKLWGLAPKASFLAELKADKNALD